MRRGLLIGLGLLGCLGCGPDEPSGPSRPSGPPSWQVVLEATPGAILRAHGRAWNDVWIVGADADGQGPLVYHFDGAALTRHDTGAQGDLWWVQGDLPSGQARMVGEAGQIVDYGPNSSTFTRRQAPTDDTLFGVWGSGQDPCWYVGGESSANRGVIWREDGGQLALPSPAPSATSSATFFKVQGLAADDVWMVGQRGRILHYDGAQLAETPTPTPLPLIALHGRSKDELYAVGGVADGVILRWNGQQWSNETPRGLPQMSGIWVTPNGTAYAAGFNGRIFRRQDGTWSELEGIPTFQDFHAIWVDPDGGIWAAGGRLASDPPKDGVLVYYGPPLPEGLAP